MIEIFITNITVKDKAEAIKNAIANHFTDLKLHFDLEDSGVNYPCEHSILRTEGIQIASEEIISIVEKSGFRCDILEDKICSG